MEPSAPDAHAAQRRADWRGERVLVSGRVSPRVRAELTDLARVRGVSVGELIGEWVERERGRLTEPAALAELAPLPAGPYTTILADPPWRFVNRTGKVAPEHGRLGRYDTLTVDEICAIPVGDAAAASSHLYLWVPNALLADGLRVMRAWGYTYKANVVWHKVRLDGGSDGRGVGFYFRNVTELLLFGVRGSLRTLQPGRTQVNYLATRKREHSRKPDEIFPIIEDCSPGPYLELFARYPQPGWDVWGNEADPEIVPRGRRYPAYGSR